MPFIKTFTKFGTPLDFECPLYDEALPNTRSYIWDMGWKQALNDAAAGKTDLASCEGSMRKKHDKIVAELLTPRGYAARKTPFDLVYEEIAENQVVDMAAKQGKTLTKVQLQSKVEYWMERNVDELTEMAEKELAKRAAQAAEYVSQATDETANALFADM